MAKPCRIIGEPDNQRPDKWSSTVPNFMKIRLSGAELFRADRRTDGQTDMKKLIVAFHNYAKARKNRLKLIVYTALPILITETLDYKR